MKFRTDFVTNSSSSSYITVKYWALPRANGQKESFPGVIIHTSTSIDSDDGKPYLVKKSLASIIKQYGIDTGTPFSAKDFFDSRFQRKEFVKYVNSKFETELQESDFQFWQIDYSIGFGESSEVDLIERINHIIEGLHPIIKNAIINENIPTEAQKKYSVRRIVISSTNTRFNRMFFSLRLQDNHEYGWDDATADFYELFYQMAGFPNIPAAAVIDNLKKAGLNNKEIQRVLEMELLVLYVGDCNINNVIVFKKPEDSKFTVFDFAEFKNYLVNKSESPSQTEKYFNIREYERKDKIDREYKKLLESVMIEKYTGNKNTL